MYGDRTEQQKEINKKREQNSILFARETPKEGDGKHYLIGLIFCLAPEELRLLLAVILSAILIAFRRGLVIELPIRVITVSVITIAVFATFLASMFVSVLTVCVKIDSGKAVCAGSQI